MDSIKNLGKNISVPVKIYELELIKKLKETDSSITNIQIFRRGLVSLCEEYKIEMA